MTQVKICGLRQVEDVKTAVAAGANAIGLVFYPSSPRSISIEHAKTLIQHIPPYVQVVALVVNPSQAELTQLAQHVPFDMIQFHGDESPAQCQQLAQSVYKRWYKAIQVRADLDILSSIAQYRQAGASAILLDAWHPELKGGTGHSFDWAEFPKTDIPLILAGGLTPENVAEAIQLTQPYAVDVSGGVESSKGIKDTQRIQQFLYGVQHATTH